MEEQGDLCIEGTFRMSSPTDWQECNTNNLAKLFLFSSAAYGDDYDWAGQYRAYPPDPDPLSCRAVSEPARASAVCMTVEDYVAGVQWCSSSG